MPQDEYLPDVHARVLRVTEDLRAIQRELNCAAMQAPGDPELMEALARQPEIESLEILKSALDQMRHFLWFYVQVMTSDCEPDKPRARTRKAESRAADSLLDNDGSISDAATLARHYRLKNRKPN
jgi:hypothetical protein